MLILQIAVGIVLGVILLAYIGDIILLGLGALVIIVVLSLIAVAGIFLYESFSALTVIQSAVVLLALFLIIKWNTKGDKIKKAIIAQIQRRKSLGYDTTDLRNRLDKIEAEEAEQATKQAIKAKEDAAIRNANKEKNKAVARVSGKAMAKEQERRRALGYED
jgi:hypothetical protein